MKFKKGTLVSYIGEDASVTLSEPHTTLSSFIGGVPCGPIAGGVERIQKDAEDHETSFTEMTRRILDRHYEDKDEVHKIK